MNQAPTRRHPELAKDLARSDTIAATAIRYTQDASQAQHDAVMGAGFFKLSHHTWNLLLDANQDWVDDLWSTFIR